MRKSLFPFLMTGIAAAMFLASLTAIGQEAEAIKNTSGLRALVEPKKVTASVGEVFDVSLRVENPTPTNQYVLVWDCSWEDNWKADNTNLVFGCRVSCAANTVVPVRINPGGAYVNKGRMMVLKPVAGSNLSFRMGFTPYSRLGGDRFVNGETLWSNKITVYLKP